MASTHALILCGSLTRVPLLTEQIANIHICGLRQERTSTDGPVRSVVILVLLVTFPKNQTKDKIHVIKFGIVDIGDDGIKDEIEVEQALITGVQVVERTDTKNVIDTLFHPFEKASGGCNVNLRDIVLILAQSQYVVMVG